MKKILIIVIAALFAIGANAQIRTVSAADTNTNAVTTYVNYNAVASHVKSFQTTVTKVSGAVAGVIYLQATVDGIAWVTIDSLTLSDQVVNTKIFPITSTSYNSYRSQFITTGSQVSYLKMAVLRRPDE